MSNVLVESETANILNTIDIENFSTIDKLSKVIVWVNHFKNVCVKKKIKTKESITAREVEDAKALLVKAVQQAFYKKKYSPFINL